MTVDCLICPACRGDDALQATARVLSCRACGRSFPNLGGIPVLFAEPERRLERWAACLAAFQAETDEAVRHVLAQSVGERLLTRTRARLTSVADGLRGHVARIVDVFAQAGLHATTEFANITPSESILSYYTLIHRDWGWAPEVDEVTPALDALVGVLPAGFRLGRTLVLGAGTARLAWELGNRVEGATDIVALDVNPLPFLVTKRLMDGHEVSMFELPGHPRRSTFACAERKLAAGQPPPRGLQLVFADGLNPPVRDAFFDTVLTPWFVDQVPDDLASLPETIRRVLRPGGAWLNQGPFVYDPARTKPVHRYCADEFIQIVSGSGFAVSKATYLPQAHMASPLSGQARSEWVLNMHATLTSGQRSQQEPTWLLAAGDELPIPMLDALKSYTAPHPFIRAVVRLVDGTRSARRIADELVARNELSNSGDVEAVQAALRVVWSELEKPAS